MFDARSTGELLTAIGDSSREESRLMGRRMIAVAELLSRRTAEAEAEDPDCGYMIITGLQRTSAEVAAEMNLSPKLASVLVSHAEALDSRLPKVRALLADGHIDWRTVQIILSRTELVTGATTLTALDSKLADRITAWQSWSRRRVISSVDALVRQLDPDAVREREHAEDRRHVAVTPLGDGTAKIDGVVAAETAVVFDRRLSELADTACPEDPRTHDQRRADAIKAMARGQQLECRCESCRVASNPELNCGTRSLVVHVIAERSTLLDGSNRPGYLEGYGVIDADLVRDLAQGARVRTLIEPQLTAEEMLRYQPTAALERFIRIRDVTCRFPGCDRPAERCDLDHSIPFNHSDPRAGGKTTAENLKCLCRQHHRLKTFHVGWRDTQLADGTVLWTSPTGQGYVTVPGSRDVFGGLRSTACVEPRPSRRNPERDRVVRIDRIRRRNRTLRPVNEARRRLDGARRKEIKGRRDRNRHRRMLVMFKGGRPTASPFMRYVNDPYESETLPTDWQPPPEPPPTAVDDPPPF